jgi:hypothetical protein
VYWTERLTNWQFVALAAAITLGVLIAMDCVMVAATGLTSLGAFIFYDTVLTALFTGFQAWMRWK